MMSSDTSMSEPIKTSIAPWLSVSRATEAVSYYQAAFGAVERYRLEDDEGSVVVAQLAIGEADFWLQEDIDSSTEVFAVCEEHGWRIGRIADPFGHHWEIGKPLR